MIPISTIHLLLVFLIASPPCVRSIPQPCQSEGDDRIYWPRSVGGDDTCFYVFTQKKNWDDARDLCATEGGDLAIYDTSAKMPVVLPLVSQHVATYEVVGQSCIYNSCSDNWGTVYHNLWIGLGKAPVNPSTPTWNGGLSRDEYRWHDGTAMHSSVRDSIWNGWSVPDRIINYDFPMCGMIRSTSGLVNDRGCNEVARVLCSVSLRDIGEPTFAHTSLRSGSTGTLTVAFFVQVNDWPSGGRVEIRMPHGLQANTGGATSVSAGPGHQPSSPLVLDHISGDGRTVRARRLGGSTSGPVFKIEVVITNVGVLCGVESLGAFELYLQKSSGSPISDLTVADHGLIPRGLIVTTPPVMSLSETNPGNQVVSFRLISEPTASVVVTANPSDLTEVFGGSVTRDTSSWSTVVSIPLISVNDPVADGDIASVVTLTTASADPLYDALPVCQTIAVTTVDDDVAGFSFNGRVASIPELGGQAKIKIKLKSQPVADVAVTVTNPSPADGTVTSGSLVFTSGDWNSWKTVTVDAINDDLNTPDAVVTMAVTSTSPDANYNSPPINPIVVTYVDDDEEPTVKSVNPAAGITDGGYQITVTGANFDQGNVADRMVRVGGTECTARVFTGDDTVVCTMPEGAGAARTVSVSVYPVPLSAASTIMFTYQSPLVTLIEPAIADTGAQPLVTLRGSNFGVASAVRTAAIGGTACSSLVFLSHTKATCNAPEGAGLNRAVTLTVASLYVPPVTQFSYNPPTLQSVNPPNGPTVGRVVTLLGANFGIPGSSRSANLGGSTCAGVTWISHTSISCTTPQGVGVVSMFRVTVDTQTSNLLADPYLYDPPALGSLVPASNFPAPNLFLTITGSNFGFGTPMVPAEVTVGGSVCTAPTWSSDTVVVCSQPDGVGGNRAVVVSVSGQPSAALMFTYFAPKITLLVPDEGPAKGGYPLTVLGANFGAASHQPLVTIGTLTCLDTAWVSDGEIRCVVPSGMPQVGGHVVDVELGAQQASATKVFTYYTAWEQHDPLAQIAVVGEELRITGAGFATTKCYKCVFKLRELQYGSENVTQVVSDPVTPLVTSEIVCKLPLYPLKAAVTDLVVEACDASRVEYIGSFAVPPFTFLPGWTAVAPKEAIAGLEVPIEVTGGGFNGTDPRYTCSFGVGLAQYASPSVENVGYSGLRCTLPKETFDFGGLSSIELRHPELQDIIAYGGPPAEDQIKLTQGAPFAPPAPRVDSVEAFRLHVAWDDAAIQDSNGDQVTSYTLFLNGQAVYLGKDKAFVIDNLNPTTTYNLTLALENPQGIGVPSQIKAIDTARSPPILIDIKPARGYQAGGQVVTITAKQLGNSKGDIREIRLSGQPCQLVDWSPTAVTCETPGASNPGFATAVVFTDVGGSNSIPETAALVRTGNALTFEYISAPRVSAVSPRTVPKSSGLQVTLFGVYMGADAQDLKSVELVGKPCVSFAWLSGTAATCVAPIAERSAGTARASSYLGGPGTVTAPFEFTVPEVQAVSPREVPMDGGAVLTVSGRALGLGYADVEIIRIGEHPCDISAMTWSEISEVTYLTCVTPKLRFLGNLNVTLRTRSGGESVGAVEVGIMRVGFNGLPPLVTGVTPSLTGLLPGGETVTIHGFDFGASASELIGISLAGTPCYAKGDALTSHGGGWVTQETVVCVAAAAFTVTKGPVLVTTLKGGEGLSPGVEWEYVSPTPILTSLRPNVVNFAGGTVVTLRGTGFGARDKKPIVSIGGTPCLESLWLSSTTVSCKMPPRSTVPDDAEVSSNAFNFTVAVQGSVSPPFGPLVYGTECDPPCGWNSACTAEGACVCFRFWSEPPECETPAIKVATSNGNYTREPSFTAVVEGLPSRPGEPALETGIVFTVVEPPESAISITYYVDDATEAVVGEMVPAPFAALDPLIPPVANSGSGGDGDGGGEATSGGSTGSNEESTGGGATGNATTTGATRASSSSSSSSSSLTDNNSNGTTTTGADDAATGQPHHLGVRAGVVVFTPADYSVPKTVKVRGAFDGIRDGDQPFRVSLADVESTDEHFASMKLPSFGLVNMDTPPTVLAVVPSLLETVGGRITILGAQFDPVVTLTAAGKVIDPSLVEVIVRLDNGTYLSLNMSGAADVTPVRQIAPVAQAKIDLPGSDAFATETFSKADDEAEVEFDPLDGKSPFRRVKQQGRMRTLQRVTANDPSSPSAFLATVGLANSSGVPPGVSHLPGSRWERWGIADPFPGQVVEIRTVVTNLTEGYVPIVVNNTDGVSAGTLGSMLFASSVCSKAGMFGVAGGCSPCPEGAVCPGGNRLWPKNGYWTPAEEAGFVRKCVPEEACIGGASWGCAPGYDGDYCSECAAGYYRDAASTCAPCPEKAVIGMLVLTSIVAYGIVALAGFTITDVQTLSHCVALVTSMQSVAAAGGAIGPRAPRRIRELYQFFALFSGDVAFVRPACVDGPKQYYTEFALQVIYNLVIGVIICGGVPVVKRISCWWNSRHGPEVVERKRLFYESRVTRMFTIWMTLSMYPITAAAAAVLACEKLGEEYRVTLAPSELCLRGEHRVAAAFAIIVLVLFTLSWPIGYFRQLKHNRPWLWIDDTFFAAWSFAYEPLKERWWWTFGFEYVLMIILAVVPSKPNTPPKTVLALCVVPHLLYFFIVLLGMRPYKRVWEGLMQMLVTVLTIVTIGYNYATSTPDTDSASLITVMYAIVLIVVVVVFWLVGAIVKSLLTGWRRGSGLHGEDYFISRAVNDAFFQSVEFGQLYKERLELEERKAAGLVGSDDDETAAVSGLFRNLFRTGTVNGSDADEENETRKSRSNGSDSSSSSSSSIGGMFSARNRRGGRGGDGATGTNDADSIIDDILIEMNERRLKGQRGSATARASARGGGGGGSGSSGDDDDDDATRRSEFASAMAFVQPPTRSLGLNRYGGVELEDEDDEDAQAFRARAIAAGATADAAAIAQAAGPTGLALATAAAASLAAAGGRGGADPDGLVEEANNAGYGVFFSEQSVMEAAVSSLRGVTQSAAVATPRTDAALLAARRIEVADPESAVPERIHDLTRGAVSRRLQVAIGRLFGGLQYAMCMTHFEQSMMPDGPDLSRERRPILKRYIFPWNQTKFNGSGTVAEMLDAIVMEITTDVRDQALARLTSRGASGYAIISDLLVKTIDYSTKRFILISVVV